MRFFFSAGEASGDVFGSEIALALGRLGAFSSSELAKDLLAEFEGTPQEIAQLYGGSHLAMASQQGLDSHSILNALIQDIDEGHISRERLLKETHSAVGGKRLQNAGIGLTFDSSDWGAVGIYESLKVATKVLEGFFTARSLLRSVHRGVFIPIDFGYINIKLAREAKKNGWKVVYFVPPGSWRRDKQGADLASVTDAIVTPFPWSRDILNEMGAHAYYFGHPIQELVSRTPDDPDRTGIALLPGSRTHEVRRNLEVIARAVENINVPLRFAVAPNLDSKRLEIEWSRYSDRQAEFVQDTYRILKSCRAAIVCSGTATLEAALCQCPMVVVYRGSPMMELEFKIRRPKFDFISQPNILLQRSLVPELLQHDAEPQKINALISDLYDDSPSRQTQLEGFEELKSICGSSDCFDKTAQLIIDLIRPS